MRVCYGDYSISLRWEHSQHCQWAKIDWCPRNQPASGVQRGQARSSNHTTSFYLQQFLCSCSICGSLSHKSALTSISNSSRSVHSSICSVNGFQMDAPARRVEVRGTGMLLPPYTPNIRPNKALALGLKSQSNRVHHLEWPKEAGLTPLLCKPFLRKVNVQAS